MGITKTKRRKRMQNLEEGYDSIDTLAAFDYVIRQFSEYHFRVNNKIDLWPSAKKWRNVQTGEMGEYVGMVEFIKNKLG